MGASSRHFSGAARYSSWSPDGLSIATTLNVFWRGFLLWTLATASVGWISTFGCYGARVILGVGESVAYRFTQNLAGFSERAGSLMLVDAGSKIGPALGTLAGGCWLTVSDGGPYFSGWEWGIAVVDTVASFIYPHAGSAGRDERTVPDAGYSPPS
jgi:hypothetical protein